MNAKYAQKFAPRRAAIEWGLHIFCLMLSAAILLGFSTPGHADDAGRCPPIEAKRPGVAHAEQTDEPDSEDSHDTPGQFREQAAAFAPDIVLHLWYQERTRHQARARAYVLATLARPDQTLSVTQRPFGWEISLRWNLLDLADAILPDEATPGRLYASDCAVFQRPADSLLRRWEDEIPLSESPDDDPERTREDW